MISKKVNIVIILLAIMLFVLTMGAFIINENSYSKNSEQLNRINEFTELKNKNDGIITELMTTPDTSLAIAFANSLDEADMKRYCDLVFRENNAEKLIYELCINGLTEQENSNLLRAKKYYDDLTVVELSSMRLIAESANIPENDMPVQVKSVQLTEKEEALSNKEKFEKGKGYLLGEKYELTNNKMLDILDEVRTSMNSRFYYGVNKITNDIKNNVVKVSVTFKFILLLQIFLFLSFFIATRKQRKTINKATKAKSEFLSRMSHDMRTPMNAIIGFSEISLDEETTNEERLDYCEKINLSGKYMLGLINDVLDMSKIEEDKMVLNLEPYYYSDFKKEIETILSPRAEAKDISLKIQEDREDYEAIEVDKMRIKQVFVNLIGNAIKFTPSGGVVECNITAKRNNNGYVNNIINIRDNGIGMSEDFIKNKLFRPFEQEHSNKIKNDNGTGLGISIVKSIIEVMDGTITCESKLGEGTTFIIQFKSKMIKGEKRTKKNGVVSLDMLSDKTVLVCEDHPLNIQIIKKLLERQKMNVVIAENGQIGVDTFINSRINQFDLIIMDIRMPIMDGLKAAKTIRELSREDAKTIPIIAMTANAFEEDVDTSLKAGMNGHLSKPIDAELMYKTIGKELLKRENQNGR